MGYYIYTYLNKTNNIMVYSEVSLIRNTNVSYGTRVIKMHLFQQINGLLSISMIVFEENNCMVAHL